jgi:hypothetical protein
MGKYTPLLWSEVPLSRFRSHLATLKFCRCGNGVRYNDLIDPPLTEVYWDMCRELDWLPPSQLEYVEEVLERCNLKAGLEVEHRVGYLGYPAYVRQHDFGLRLIEKLGKPCVIGGAMLDASYGVDWAVTHPEDPDAKLYGIHLSVNTRNSVKDRSHTTRKTHVCRNIEYNIDFRNKKNIKIGGGEQFVLHPEEDMDDLISIIKPKTAAIETYVDNFGSNPVEFFK